MTRRWLWALAALAALRVTIPLAALAASGHALPGLPRYEYDGLTGDATGFYAATREFIASPGRLAPALLAGLVAAAVICAGAIAIAWRRRLVRPAWLIVAATALFALVVAAVVTQMQPPGAAVFGWSLVWSLPMFPYRALGGPLDPDIAFAFGLVLSLAANAATVVATAYLGLHATGRRTIGLAGASAYALWPLLMGVVGGHRAWDNGTWTVDAGLALYTEPLSTALVTTGLALVLSPRLDDLRLVLAGTALGAATLVKLSNGLIAAVALVFLLLQQGARRSLAFLAAALPFTLIVATYWPKGYAREELLPDDPFALRYADNAWADSLLFGPRTLAVVLPPAILGAIVLRPAPAGRLLGACVIVTAALYSFYRVTPQHPRFLFAVVPALMILWVVGVDAVVRRVRAYTAQSPARIRT